MIPGPDHIIGCPHCDALARCPTMLFGNTNGKKAWTDGRDIAPMLPRPPAFVTCHACSDSYWLAAASGGSLPMIGALLGHSQPQTTARYAHLANDPLQRLNQEVGDAIAEAMTKAE